MRSIQLLVIIFLVSGCSTNLSKIPSNPDKAIVIAYSDSVGQALVPLAATTNTRLEIINGHNVHDAYDSSEVVTLDAGIHQIIVSCQYLQGAIKARAKTEHKIELLKGKKYIFKAILDRTQGCTTRYEVI